MSLKILHFADAHIDMANYGRQDTETALPIRVMDFLKSLDILIDKAIDSQVDLVLFAGDTYKDRNPQPTFQREWGLRMKRLSHARIPTVLLVGNHDVSPAVGRAHTVQEFKTFEIPYVFVADEIAYFSPETLKLPVQLISIPWISRSGGMSKKEMFGKSNEEMLHFMEERIHQQVQRLLDQSDPKIPLILLAHASVQGAQFGSERFVMLGQELVLQGSLLRHPHLDYVALGHIHKHQALHPQGSHPPILYPGSIERINFGEAQETKGFILAEISRGKSSWEFHPLPTRPFLDILVHPPQQETFMADIFAQLPPPEQIREAVCRLQLSYPREWESLLDEMKLAKYFEEALSFQIQKQRSSRERSRLGTEMESFKTEDLLKRYWQFLKIPPQEQEALQALAQELFSEMDRL